MIITTSLYMHVQECHTLQADCANELVEPWGLVRTTLVDWPPAQYDYSYDSDAGMYRHYLTSHALLFATSPGPCQGWSPAFNVANNQPTFCLLCTS